MIGQSTYDANAVETALIGLLEAVDDTIVTLRPADGEDGETVDRTGRGDDNFSAVDVPPGALPVVEYTINVGDTGDGGRGMVENRNGPVTFGQPGNNRHDEHGWVMFHIAIHRRDPISKARAAWAAVFQAVAGQHVDVGDDDDSEDKIHFQRAGAEHKESGGAGLARGISRSITYRYEFRHI